MACLIAPIATVLIVNHLENKDKIMVRIVTLWHRLTLVTPLFDRQKSLYCSRENAFFFGKTHYVCFSDFVLLTHHNIILSLSLNVNQIIFLPVLLRSWQRRPTNQNNRQWHTRNTSQQHCLFTPSSILEGSQKCLYRFEKSSQ